MYDLPVGKNMHPKLIILLSASLSGIIAGGCGVVAVLALCIAVKGLCQNKGLAQQSEHPRFVACRDFALVVFLCLYVVCCTLIPVASFNYGGLDCEAGFLWEMHMPFLMLFVATKAFEFFLYMRDTSLDEELSPLNFLWKFGLSCAGYLDAYQDSISAAIALSCDAHSAQILGQFMLGCFVVGVVILQWGIIPCLAFQDESKAVVFKLIHMDTVSYRLTLSDEDVFNWKLLQIFRTVCEDIPQAALQTIYIFGVSQNFFMILSVCTSVCGSLFSVLTALSKRGGRLISEEQGQAARRVKRRKSSFKPSE